MEVVSSNVLVQAQLICLDINSGHHKLRTFIHCDVKNIFYQVMTQKHNRQMSFSLYISALAVSDTFFLLNGEVWIDSLIRSG